MSALVIDGAHGEGGGQIVRTAVAIAAITGRPIRIERVRAGRPKPGLAAQHLASIHAAAAVCRAALAGDTLGSATLDFAPAGSPRAGDYLFDVGVERAGGSAGAAALVLQTVLLPLALAGGRSTVVLRGGTHNPWSPPFDYLRDVWLPALASMGVAATAALARWGWYPVGRGEIRATVEGGARPGPLRCEERGALVRVGGRAVASRLPAHIPERMAARARAALAADGIAAELAVEQVEAACPGTGIFLAAEYEHARAGFGAFGVRGKPAEAVAEEAVAALLAHRRAGAALDLHLADQLLLPAALAAAPSLFTVERPTRHLTTNADLIERFGLARIAVAAGERGAAVVSVQPARS